MKDKENGVRGGEPSARTGLSDSAYLTGRPSGSAAAPPCGWFAGKITLTVNARSI